MERRKKGSGRVDTVACRQCGAETIIDPRRMSRAGSSWQLRCHECGTDFPVRLSDPRGTHTIKITTREDGFSIDQIVLSSAKYLSASPGALKNDATILPACPQPPLR